MRNSLNLNESFDSLWNAVVLHCWTWNLFIFFLSFCCFFQFHCFEAKKKATKNIKKQEKKRETESVIDHLNSTNQFRFRQSSSLYLFITINRDMSTKWIWPFSWTFTWKFRLKITVKIWTSLTFTKVAQHILHIQNDVPHNQLNKKHPSWDNKTRNIVSKLRAWNISWVFISSSSSFVSFQEHCEIVLKMWWILYVDWGTSKNEICSRKGTSLWLEHYEFGILFTLTPSSLQLYFEWHCKFFISFLNPIQRELLKSIYSLLFLLLFIAQKAPKLLNISLSLSPSLSLFYFIFFFLTKQNYPCALSVVWFNI